MQVSGPYSPSSGTPINLTDPAKYTEPDVAAQIQNASGYLLTVTVGGYQTVVPPRTVSTVSLNASPYLTLTPAPMSGADLSGTISVIWLLAHERSPVADGPIATSPTTSGTVGITSTSVANTVTPTTAGNCQISLAAPAAPSQDVKISVRNSNGIGAVYDLTATGVQSGHVYAISPANISANTTITAVIPVTPAYGDTEIAVTSNGGTNVTYGASSSPEVTTSQVPPSTTTITILYQIMTAQAGLSAGALNPLGTLVAGSTFLLSISPGIYSAVVPISNPEDQLALEIFGSGLSTDWKVLSVSYSS